MKKIHVLPKQNICFVGQGPNQTSWDRNLAKAQAKGFREHEQFKFAIEMGKRLAITGAIGIKLAEMMGFERLAFLASFRRANLNTRFNGKQGKGDVFDMEEGKKAAAALMRDLTIDKFVLLGEKVSNCFGFTYRALEMQIQPATLQTFFMLPHPSGINTWYNDKNNVRLAARMLKAFCNVE